eukprot:TRINITY_DN7284_c0_g1_i2.p1 TRINITY_DN7284_c0_g1~~TRINITY_DN7284_c0_g1_i2.p1  ORF type:complete len:623 (+),score=77.26 TRINITY_DN7284_c0_g1_i2:227-1870(+)
MLMLMQLGGIPVARGIAGRVLWTLHVGTLLLQYVLTLLSVVQILCALIVVQLHYEVCMISGPAGIGLFTWLLLVFPFQPLVIFKLALALIYFQAIIVDIVVLAGTSKCVREWKGNFCFNRVMRICFRCCGKTDWPPDSMQFDELFSLEHAVCLIVFFLGPGLIVWICSAAFVFSVAFFLPMTLACLSVAGILHALVVCAHVSIRKCCNKRCVRAVESMNWVQRFGVDVQTLNGFLRKRFGQELRHPASAFTHTLFYLQLVLTASIMIVYGALAASFAYTEFSHMTYSQVLAFCYELTFGIADSIRFSVPMLSFDLPSVWSALIFLGNVSDWMEFDPVRFVRASHALGVLTFLVAQLKVLVSAAAFLRTLIENSKATSLPFHVSAQWNLSDTSFVKKFNKALKGVKPSADNGSDIEDEEDPSESDVIASSSHQHLTTSADHNEQHAQHLERPASNIDNADQWPNGYIIDDDVHRARQIQPAASTCLICVGDTVAFTRSNGDSVLSLVTHVDYQSETCVLEYEGVVQGELKRLRKQFVSFQKLRKVASE